MNDSFSSESLLRLNQQSSIERFMRAVARAPVSALLLDYDGTLAPFVVDRQRASPYPRVSAWLRRIMDSGRTRVVIVTGRNASEIVPLLGIDPIPEIWGSHGMQRLWPDGKCEISAIEQEASSALADAGRWLTHHALQHLAEFKPGGIALHWRGLPESDVSVIRDQVLRGWCSIAQDALLSVLEFDGGIELRVRNPNKGDAVQTIVDEIEPDAPVAYLGDDVTDERAFDALSKRGLSVLVRPLPRETSARVWLKPPDELLDFLTRWAEGVSETGVPNYRKILSP
jgi:trehalose 6-phosphate phosphatase